ncbi:MAG: hypothetical protein AAF843_09775 [Bacteroidota bacterium]
MTKNQVALLVFACDRYQFLYKGFEYTFHKYWNKKVDLNYYFSTENSDLKVKGFKMLKSGAGPWTNRLKKVLQCINEEYVIFLQEDMWMNRTYNAQALEELLNYALEKQFDLVKLHSTPSYKTIPTGNTFSDLDLFELDKKTSKFLMSHQVSLWKKEFLTQNLPDNEDPWMNEHKGTKRLKKTDASIYQIDLLQVNDLGPGQGSYKTVSYDAVIAKEATIFFDEMAKEYPEYVERMKFNLENQITHDGNPKPRVKGLLNKVKRELRYHLGKF